MFANLRFPKSRLEKVERLMLACFNLPQSAVDLGDYKTTWRLPDLARPLRTTTLFRCSWIEIADRKKCHDVRTVEMAISTVRESCCKDSGVQ